MKRTKAMNIQHGITRMLNLLRKKQVLSKKDFDYLYKRTHDELYPLANKAGKDACKLEAIKVILER